ncbi:uncharacterized protein LOC114761951 [Neltuma alba]|uniref:uncharacterized protein LOC114761951 n=1 Tax=Neltuma alba TaxID=207710 RepID=UPI0010A2AF3C|nr:uncharacterized protein LOC114761951 [Prosopis alba]
MDSFNFPNLPPHKATPIPTHHLFSALTKALRILELCLALLILSWTLPRLPFALSLLRQFSLFLSSPLFVFFLSNAIIATLVAKSGRSSRPGSTPDADAQIYHELLKNSAHRTAPAPEADPDPLLRVAGGEVVYQDKEIVSETNSTDRTSQDKADTVAIKDTDSKAGLDSDFAKVYRRTQSEKLKEECPERTQQKLRRSETEKKHMENGRESMYPQDNLSNEEFQRTIEAFIAKQMRFLREESLAIVIQNQS